MVVVSVSEFRRNVENICSKSEIVMRTRILSETRNQIRMRIFLANRTFLDVYYNSKTGKTAFAQIRDERRIFGADNTNGKWHWHLYENPQGHDFTNETITFEQFLKNVEKTIEK